ncbi:hypothetical protein HK098_000915 [Nowakowskiella sp. JEL0407]|nr:hypothetical protein HK098_000915 [Nowakowskiella sp. JEL0407]
MENELDNLNVKDDFEKSLNDVEDDDEAEDNFGYVPLDNSDQDTDKIELEEAEIPEPPTLIVKSKDKLSDDDSELIKNIMSNFSMPASAVPDWAKVIPEEMWIPKVMESSDFDFIDFKQNEDSPN